jgi:squalene cyclase
MVAFLGDIMVDYSYVECTSACLQALHLFRKYYPDYRTSDLE